MRTFVLAWALVVQQATPWVDSAPHKAQSVTVAEGVQLEVLDFGGSGRPLVLLPGLGNTAHVFDEFAPKLAGIGRVYAVTRRGYGASSRPETGYDVDQLGQDVLVVIKALGLRQPMLIGHSYRWTRAQLPGLRAQGPHRCVDLSRRRVSVCVRRAQRVREGLPIAASRAESTARDSPAFVLPEAERRQPRGSPTAARAIAAGSRQFANIRLPALAIFASPHDVGADVPDQAWERFDEAVTERQARAFERGVPGARVVRWSRASHYLFLTRGSDVVREITQFVTGLP